MWRSLRREGECFIVDARLIAFALLRLFFRLSPSDFREKTRLQCLIDDLRRNAEKEKTQQLETFQEQNRQLTATIESLQKELSDRLVAYPFRLIGRSRNWFPLYDNPMWVYLRIDCRVFRLWKICKLLFRSPFFLCPDFFGVVTFPERSPGVIVPQWSRCFRNHTKCTPLYRNDNFLCRPSLYHFIVWNNDVFSVRAELNVLR